MGQVPFCPFPVAPPPPAWGSSAPGPKRKSSKLPLFLASGDTGGGRGVVKPSPSPPLPGEGDLSAGGGHAAGVRKTTSLAPLESPSLPRATRPLSWKLAAFKMAGLSGHLNKNTPAPHQLVLLSPGSSSSRLCPGFWHQPNSSVCGSSDKPGCSFLKTLLSCPFYLECLLP